jgi:hypothetical protein
VRKPSKPTSSRPSSSPRPSSSRQGVVVCCWTLQDRAAPELTGLETGFRHQVLPFDAMTTLAELTQLALRELALEGPVKKDGELVEGA